jgi:hypothetical protein
VTEQDIADSIELVRQFIASIEKLIYGWFFDVPTLKSVGTPMYKGIEACVGCLWPYTHLYLTLHSDVITTDKRKYWKETDGRGNPSLLFFRRQRTLSP